MVDFRVDDGFADHPKILDLPLDAIGAWTLAGVWCAKHLTDGYIPGSAMKRITRRPHVLQQLIDHGLLIPLADGYQFVDWLQYQRSKEQVLADQAANRRRQARWRKRGDHTPGVTP